MKQKFIHKYMRLAKQVGEDSNPCYSRQIGVVVADPTNNIVLSTGYNGPPRSSPHCDSQEYLENIIWPQINTNDVLRVIDKFEKLPDGLYDKERLKHKFLNFTTNCKQCPRKLMDFPSGQRLELCSCLSYESRVELSNGRLMKIGDIVRNKYNGQVKSYDIVTNRVVYKDIVGWHKLPLTDNFWYKIITKYSKYGKHGQLGPKFTHDHKILTNYGWTTVSDLQPGDQLVTKYAINNIEEQLILGSCMGDSSILKTPSSARFKISHSTKQDAYIHYKLQLLTSVKTHFYNECRTKVVPGSRVYPNHTMVNFITEATPQLLYYRNLLYANNGKKFINQSWLDKIEILGLMFWYLDNGSKIGDSAGYIALHNFKGSEQLIINWLQQKFNINTRMTTGHHLYFDSTNFDKLCKMISKYVPMQMRYKILSKYHDEDLITPTETSTTTFYDEVENVQKLPSTISDDDKHSYCIDVKDTHNFLTLNCIAHNCEHGERNAIFNSGNNSLAGSYMFCWCGVPCWDCCKAIIQARIQRVYCLKVTPDYSSGSRWLLNSAGVELIELLMEELINDRLAA